jgi:multiple sugar transport system substrate-binding protein
MRNLTRSSGSTGTGGRGRTRLAAVVLAAASLAVAACGGSSGSGGGGSAGNAEKATLTFVNAQDPGTFDKVIAGFHKKYPDIKIKQEVVPFDDLNTTVQSRLQSKDSGIDLYDVDEPRLAAFASRGYLLDLSDLVAQAHGTISDTALNATKFDGKQYAMPRWTSTQLLFYNRALLKKAGVPFPGTDPSSRMTWEDVTTAGKKAQSAGAKWGLTFDQVDRYYQLQPLPESLGAGPGLTGKGLLKPDVTNAGWVKAFSWYGSTFDSGLSPRGITAEQTSPLFASGNTAFYAGGPWNAPAFQEAKVDFGVAPYPMFAGGKPASSTGSWATGVSPFSKNQAAAKKFIAYMTTDPTGAWEMSSNNIPVQQDAFKKYLDTMRQQGGEMAKLATIIEQELSTSAVSRPTTTAYVDFETVINKAFADIRNGANAADRLKTASKELDSVLSKYQS